MDKKVLKEFAIMARRELRDEITLKANILGLSEDHNCEIYVGSDYVKINEQNYPRAYEKAYIKLIEIKKEKGFDALIEEVAYTWFNRFIAIRFMEANDYLPSHIRVLSSEVEGKVDPDILEQYKECDLDVDTNEIDLLINEGNTEGAYRKLLIAQCNKLSKMMPFLFEEINDCTEMLLPDKLLIPQSIIKKLVNTISEDDFREQVEIIGWIYQYYISEKKDEVFADLKKNIKITKENIPAATQLFTPDWIVKYMVENSLGRLWLEGHPDKELQSCWKYYLEEAEQEPEVLVELVKIKEEHSKLTPEDIKVLDPCMGSGHILVYAFDVLYQIYLSAGYVEKDIPRLILEKNIYGLDIDDRAAQLAGFALVMKARSYSRRFFREIEKNPLEINVCAIQESRALDEKGENQISGITEDEIEYFANGDVKLKEDLEYLVEVFTDAKEYGSILEVEEVDFGALKQRLNEINKEDNLMFVDYRKILIGKLPLLLKQQAIISRKYEVCITNPPYMGIKQGINKNIYKYINENFKDSKSDLYSVFIERCINFSKKHFYISMITQQTWMFLNSYKQLRSKVLDGITISNLLHLGPRAFSEISGEVVQTAAYTFLNRNLDKYYGVYDRLVDYGSNQKENEYISGIHRYCGANQEIFKSIEDNPIIYWISTNSLNTFKNEVVLGDRFKLINGPDSKGNNDNYFMYWYEVSIKNISFTGQLNKKQWFPLNKGANKKWYGNNLYVSHKDFANMNLDFMNAGISWLDLSSSFSCRYIPSGYTFNNHGKMCIGNLDELKYLLGYLNSKVAEMFVHLFTVKTKYEVGYVKKIPFKLSDYNKRVDKLVDINIDISKKDWDELENSWDFKTHPLLKLLKIGEQYKLNAIFNIWENECENIFKQLKYNEEELNRIFIDIYGLQDELTPEVKDKDITIRKADRKREIKSFISYAVGCMLGRYSIDSEGLIYAGGDFKDKWSLEEKKVRKIVKDEEGTIVSDSWVETTFLPDSDNVIPITENEYFGDDIVSRFIEFVKTVYGEETLNENLDFIADTLVKKNNETSRERIRRYFMDEFFMNHCKVYQKRPIYWLVDSGKNKGFRALIYLHRYNKETLANIRLNYVLELQGKYINEEKQIERYLDNGTLTLVEKKKYTKELQVLSQKQNELVAFDKVLDELANQKIELDLDDGVVINYEKLQPILAKIK